MSRLRTMPPEFPAVDDHKKVTLIFVPSGSDEPIFGANTKHKQDVLRAALGGSGTLMAVWVGKWRSDVFKVSDEQLANWAAKIGIGP